MTTICRSSVAAIASAFLLTAAVQAVRADDSSAAPGIVSHIKVVSDKIEDVSSLEAWKKSFIKDGMTDQQKAIAIWTSVCKFRHQGNPPNEGLMVAKDLQQSNVHDPIKSFNVYGYGMCCCASGNIEGLARYAGMEARGWGINAHSVPEINVSGHWGMFDASLMNYFMMPDKKTVAGIDDIHASIAEWMNQHPDNKTKKSKELEALMKNGGWKSGPTVLAGGTGYDNNGWLPAKTHTWGSSVIEFGGADVKDGKKAFLFDYATAVGYEVNIQLRPGERITRSWTNQGHHVNEFDSGSKYPVNEKELGYAAKWGDLNTNARIGNGTLEYNLPLAGGQFKNGMLTVDNLASKSEAAGPAVHVKDGSKPATLIFRMPASYIYLGGELNLNAVIGSGGSIVASISDNNGLDWKPLPAISGGSQKIDLKKLIYRRYDYRLKFELKGAGTGLEAIDIVNEIQNSTRALPALDAGDNKISFSSAAQEGTITVDGNMKADLGNLTFEEFHPIVEGGKTTVPVTTPGDITRVRASASYRCSADKDAFLVQASFDEGKTFVDMGKFDGVGRGMSKYLVFEKVPAGVKSVQVRLTTQGGASLQDFRIDADYKEPHGGFVPVKITYNYEDGGAKSDVHVARSATDNYSIKCPGKPTMKSITMELAQ